MSTAPASKKGSHSFWARLQPRERKLIMGLLVTTVVMALGILFVLRNDRFSAIEDEIASLKRGTTLARVGGASYQEMVDAKERRESLISDKPLLFSTLVEQAEAAAGVTAEDQEEKPVMIASEELKKRTYSFRLRNVTLEALVKFLSYIESNGEHIVMTQRLDINSASGQEDRLSRVSIELATWERAIVEDDKADDGGNE